MASGTLQFKLEDEVIDVPAGTVVRDRAATSCGRSGTRGPTTPC